MLLPNPGLGPWWEWTGGAPLSPSPVPVTLQVAAKALETGMFGAYFNVLINLKDISDDKFKDQVSSRGSGPGPSEGPAGGPWGCGLQMWARASGSSPSREVSARPPALDEARGGGIWGGSWLFLFARCRALAGPGPILAADQKAAGIGALCS